MRTLLLISLLLAAGCRATGPAEVAIPDAWRAELAGRAAGPAQACISDFPNQALRVVNSTTVAYDAGRTMWINRLLANCPALSPHNTLIVERSGSQICRGDRIRGLEPGGIIPGPSCNLQDWVPYRLP